MSHPFSRRLLKEHKAAMSSHAQGIEFLSSCTVDSYQVRIAVENNLYAGAVFLLAITIPQNYPVDSPLVKFVKSDSYAVPVHPHIYSNGHICLNILGNDWTPACGVESVVLSVQSMLSTNSLLERPPDDDQYVRLAPRDPKASHFVYHDDSV